MSSTLQDQAIRAALATNWKEAVKINTQLLKEKEDDIDSLNRLGFAYLQLGMGPQAKKFFNKVIHLDKYNQIALKNIKKLESGKTLQGENSIAPMSPLMFLEDPGKTKIVQCINTAPDKILARLSHGQEVSLKPKKYAVEIRDMKDTYLGALPDDLSFKMIKYTEGGNTYHAVVKGVTKNTLVIFLREMTRGKKFKDQPSFTATTSYVPFSKIETVTDAVSKPDVTATGEEEDETPDSD